MAKKSKNNLINIFQEHNCPSIRDLKKYNNGQLPKGNSHHIEKHLIDCEFCSEVLEGIEYNRSKNVSLTPIKYLNKVIIKRIIKSNAYQNKSHRIKYWAIAASFFLIFSLVYLYQDSNDTDKIYNQYYNMFPNLTPIARGKSSNSTFLKAMQAYETNKLLKAEILLSLISPTDKHYHSATFYLGVLAMNNGEFNRAQYLFRTVLNRRESKMRVYAKWYLALSYLKSKKFLQCKVLLHDLIDSNSVYKEKCERILNHMN